MISLLELPALRKEIVSAEKKFSGHSPEEMVIHTSTLRKCGLWWASRDMTKLAISTAPEMPEWTPAIAAPEPIGFMWFSAPIGSTPDTPPAGFKGDGAPTESVLGAGRIQGVHWSLQAGHTLTLTLYGTCVDEVQRARTVPVTRDIYEIGVYKIIADQEFSPSSGAIPQPWAAKVVHTLGAAWILMQQPTVATTRKAKGVGGGVGKKKPPKTSLVQVIELRRLAHKHSEEKGHATREFHTRWMVRGHWRQQRVGPGRKYVRPVYVAPYIKGPEDAPLKTDRVNAWRR
ncbi:hypothetical protein [Corynebacterium glucuronolyticum]|uniref:hypothetical protein n=1 Tax=Corynebacterium glucuronolyticum TaxID=39791 RepID=UPI0009D00324|nr:hypothetical protein [Corynebacterium glucuronolyticum]WKD64008.1 hypothetical protein CGLUCO_08815 [Corynebacterium glucuronolyticum DSM 44120]SMB83359.1 hypothetical protein SAMN05660745_02643 [Corynebacterium glucuronolyticum]